jgi:hypothetical protein
VRHEDDDPMPVAGSTRTFRAGGRRRSPGVQAARRAPLVQLCMFMCSHACAKRKLTGRSVPRGHASYVCMLTERGVPRGHASYVCMCMYMQALSEVNHKSRKTLRPGDQRSTCACACTCRLYAKSITSQGRHRDQEIKDPEAVSLPRHPSLP